MPSAVRKPHTLRYLALVSILKFLAKHKVDDIIEWGYASQDLVQLYYSNPLYYPLFCKYLLDDPWFRRDWYQLHCAFNERPV